MTVVNDEERARRQRPNEGRLNSHGSVTPGIPVILSVC